ncbi:unnamed protein product, partial [Prorocentrum cordatum]
AVCDLGWWPEGPALWRLADGASLALTAKPTERIARDAAEAARCDRCGTPNADEVHRFFACPARRAERASAGLTQQFADRCVQCVRAAFLCRGLMPAEATRFPVGLIP